MIVSAGSELASQGRLALNAGRPAKIMETKSWLMFDLRQKIKFSG